MIYDNEFGGKTYYQDTPPPSGATYEWEGEPHNSRSIMRENGVIARVNLAHDPSYVRHTSRPNSAGRDHSISTDHSYVGPSSALITTNEELPSRAFVSAYDVASGTHGMPVATGEVYTFSLWAMTEHPNAEAYVNFRFSDEQNNFLPQVRDEDKPMAPGVWQRFSASGVVPPEARALWYTGLTIQTVDRSVPPPGVRSFMDAALMERTATVGDYFDGDFEDDRVNDIWVDTRDQKNVAHRWDNATKSWVTTDMPWREPWGNLIPDGGFEGEPIGVRPINLRGEIVSSPVLSGSKALKMVATGSSNAHWAHSYVHGDRRPEVTPGEIFDIDLSLIIPTGGSLATVCQFADINGSPLYAIPGSIGSTGGVWLEVNRDVVVPEGAVSLRGLYLNISASVTPGMEMFADNISLTRRVEHSGVSEVSFATTKRLGTLAEVTTRTRDKISLSLVPMSDPIYGGERIVLSASAAGRQDLTWRWKLVEGPQVEIERQGSNAHIIAPDVDAPTHMRVAVYGASPDGAARSDWHFFDLTVRPAMFRSLDSSVPTPSVHRVAGYERGFGEVWNDVLPPVTMGAGDILTDLGVEPDDIQFRSLRDEGFPTSAPPDGYLVNTDDWTIYRNFGRGYNENPNTVGAPRRRAYWVDPASGNVYKWDDRPRVWLRGGRLGMIQTLRRVWRSSSPPPADVPVELWYNPETAVLKWSSYDH